MLVFVLTSSCLPAMIEIDISSSTATLRPALHSGVPGPGLGESSLTTAVHDERPVNGSSDEQSRDKKEEDPLNSAHASAGVESYPDSFVAWPTPSIIATRQYPAASVSETGSVSDTAPKTATDGAPAAALLAIVDPTTIVPAATNCC